MSAAARTILQLGNAALRRKCAAVGNITGTQTQTHIDSLLESLRGSSTGCGLAAPQIDLPLRMFALEETEGKKDFYVCVNPRVIGHSKTVRPYPEACLSVPGMVGVVYRPAEVEVEYHSRQGERVRRKLAGFPARVFQHELDHLDGLLFVDRLRSMRDLYTEEEFDRQMNSGQINPNIFVG